MAKQALSTNTFTVAKWVVSADATQGTHTTIQSAITDASSGDTIFIRDGSYTENLTLKAGVSLCAFDADAQTPNVTIIGKASYSSAGSTSLCGIRLQTNGDFLLSVTGAAAVTVTLTECYLNATNNTAIEFTNSNASSQISIVDSFGNLGAMGIAVFSHSSDGNLSFYNSQMFNSGGSTTSSTCSVGSLGFFNSQHSNPITTSGTATFNSSYSAFPTSGSTALTINGTGLSGTNFDSISSGTASAISVGPGAQLDARGSTILSTNATTIAGTGTFNFSAIGNGSNTITFGGGLTVSEGTGGCGIYTGTFTPTVVGGTVAGVTTYTSQTGTFTRVGNYVWVNIAVNYTAATGTGDLTIGALPFVVLSVAQFGTGFVSGSVTWPVGATHTISQFLAGTSTAKINTTGSTAGSAFMQIANTATQVLVSGMYRIA